ncbi:ATP-dependent DNA helicase Q1 [Paramuricea clavata]|uniref:DNA 3'-5' helicase n=1 Tax=Paramuricea clavata TaxID=317549 RepID=A0A6S7I9F1_PARCT|nr:ATP-dependent DNA helicase Q1 [Paramuricea clavata]
MELLQSKPYQESVQSIIVDEAHCILEWGLDLRKDYSNLAMLCATFPTVPVVALTATASKADVILIKESLNLKKPVEIAANPAKPNIFYENIIRKGNDLEFFQELLHNQLFYLKSNWITL